jgi:hypothetical protein
MSTLLGQHRDADGLDATTSPSHELRMTSRSWIIRSRTTSTSVPRSTNGARRWHSMKRGRVITPASARIAGLKRSRWPDLKDPAARGGELDEGPPLGAGRGDRLLDQDVDAGLEQYRAAIGGARWSAPRGDAVDPADQLGDVGSTPCQPTSPATSRRGRGRDRRRRPARRRAAPRTSPRERRRDSRRRSPRATAHRRAGSSHPPARSSAGPRKSIALTPTTARPCASAPASSSSRSSISVLPASRASTAMPASAQTATVSRPTAGTSKRRSCPGLLVLTTTAPPAPGRRRGGWRRRSPRSPRRRGRCRP